MARLIVLLALLVGQCSVFAEELHLLFIRHVQSRWNQLKKEGGSKIAAVTMQDAGVSKDGVIELQRIYDEFGEVVLPTFKNIFVEGPAVFHFEASNLRRAQLTTIAAFESLRNAAAATPDSAAFRFDEAPFEIVRDLQEASVNFDAWSKFEKGFLSKHTACDEWYNYLLSGWPEEGSYSDSASSDFLYWKSMKEHKFYTEDLCNNVQYIASKSMKLSPFEALKKSKSRYKEYGERLYKQMKNGVKLIVVGGHSNWFVHFVNFHTAAIPDSNAKKELLDRFGSKTHKVPNGHMVHVVLEADTKREPKTVKIKSIQQLFPAH